MQKEPFVLVGLAGYKQKEWVEPVIKTIKSTNYKNYSITFVDNSNDGSVALVKEKFPDILAIQSATNSGFAGGHNQCFKSKPSQYYVVHDLDIEHIDPEWLHKMIEKLEKDPNGGIAGGVIVPMHLREKFDEKRIKKIIPKNMLVHMVSGSLMVVKSDVFEELNMFDEDYFIYWEETDFQYRALMKGYNIWWMNIPYFHFTGSSTSLHEQSKTSFLNPDKSAWENEEGKPRVRGFHYNYRNEIMFMLINLKGWYLLKSFIMLLIRTGYHSTLKFYPRKIKEMYLGWEYIFQNFGKILVKRKEAQKDRKKNDWEIAKLQKSKDDATAKLNVYFKEMEAELLKEKKIERMFYH